MKRHDESLLWQYAARELSADEGVLVEHHLSECTDCRERLLDVRQARLVLQDAQSPRPRVQWAKVDQGISQLVEARLVRQAKAARVGWRLPLAFAAVAALALTFTFIGRLEFLKPVEVAAIPPAAPEPTGAQVEQALGLTRVGAELSIARAGERLTAGEVLRTAVGGRGLVILPDGSRMRLAGGSQLALTRADSDDVALTLERGRVAIKASHRVRRGFVVHSSGMAVRVIGTLFTVSQASGLVEVAVCEGKVLVEPPEGAPFSLVGGERVRFERGTWKPIRGAATAAQISELKELSAPPLIEAAGVPRAPAAGLMPAGAMARRDDSAARNGAAQQSSQVVGVALTPVDPPPAQPERLLPRKPSVPHGAATSWPSGPAAKAEDPGAPVEEQLPQLEEKASVWPSMGGGPVTYEPRVLKRSSTKNAPPVAELSVAAQQPAAPLAGPIAVAPDLAPVIEVEAAPPAPQPASDPAEFGDFPKAQPPPIPAELPVQTKGRPAAAQKLKRGEPLPEDLEAMFLQRAERSLERGSCERYLLGLQEVAGDASRNERSQKARILRARCYDARVRPDLSEIEYRRYLEVWPKGRHSDEARKAVME